MAAVEETLARINTMSGVEYYVVIDGSGIVLRHSKHFKGDAAAAVASDVRELADAARHAIRDIEPSDDLIVLRLRGRDKELLLAPAGDCFVVVVQRWRAAPIDDTLTQQ